MIIRRADRHATRITDCHEGSGVLWCAELLAEDPQCANGFKFIHDNHLEPGATIGEHRHDDDEEIYIILGGHGTMHVDGVAQPVGPGDVCLTRRGHSHDLTNSQEGMMHFLVVGTHH